LIGIVSLSFYDEDGFTALSLPLEQGSQFTPIIASDSDNNEIILSASLAKRLYKDENPIGQTLYADREVPRKVVGVVCDI
ncbi:ABC transporter permease, partial [Pseudoalteromonas sp. S3178]|uniref:ABC transporter permease n=1 Tax=Pseudoalteromonas sp. S3178 TaxID=579532 RepID=UPI002015FE74